MQHETKTNQNGIIGLAVVFGVGLFALGAALTLTLGALSELSKDRNAISGDQSFYNADAAAREGAYQFINDASTTYAGGAPVLLNGSATAAIAVASLAWPYVEVHGEAENARNFRTSIYILTLFPEGFAFDYAVYAQNNLTFGGNIEVNGSVFANNGIDFNGASAQINGNAYSPAEIEDTGNINGDAFGGVNIIPPPGIDFEVYRNIAASSTPSTLFSSAADAETYLNGQVREAVVYVEDTVKTKVQGAGTQLTGSLVTEHDLDITGGTYNATGTYVAVAVNGDLKIAGGATINGIVYVTGETSFGGGTNTINGSLISAGGATADVAGNAVINFDPDIAASWQNLSGLDTTSTSTPVIVEWREE